MATKDIQGKPSVGWFWSCSQRVAHSPFPTKYHPLWLVPATTGQSISKPTLPNNWTMNQDTRTSHVAPCGLEVSLVSVCVALRARLCLSASVSDWPGPRIRSKSNSDKLLYTCYCCSYRFNSIHNSRFRNSLALGTQELFANPFTSAPRPLACPRVNARFLHRRKQPMLPWTKWQNPSHSARPAGLQE